MFSQRVTRETRALTQMVWVLATGAVIIVPVALRPCGLPAGDEWTRRGTGGARRRSLLRRALLPAAWPPRRRPRPHLRARLAAGRLRGRRRDPAGRAGHAAARGRARASAWSGAVFTSFEGRAGSTNGAPWAFAAGLLFAGVMLCYAYGDIDWLSQMAISRSVSLLITLPVALLTGSVAVPRALRVRAVGAGVLELSGVVLLTITFALGPPTVAGVTTTQFGHLRRDPGFRAPARAPEAQPVGRHRLHDRRGQPAGRGRLRRPAVRRRAPAALLPPPDVHAASAFR